MEINYTFNFWDNILTIISIVVSSILTFWIYKLTQQLSSKDRFQHEIKITKKIRNDISIYSSIILADVKKYHPIRADVKNESYYKQGGEIYTIIPGYGIEVILQPSDEKITVGLIPFDWIEYIRDFDSEDNKSIIVCKFKGIKWYKNFRSPFKEINYIYNNPRYREDVDPDFMKFTRNKSK